VSKKPLKVPENITPYETSLSTMWFDNEGIFYSVTKKNAALNKKNLQETFDYIHSKAGDKKVCWIGDVTDTPPPEKEARDYAAEITPKMIKALALLTNSSLSKMIAEIFMLVKKPPYPTRMFTSEAEALIWIRSYLD
jgi:hypothetical protein